MKQPEDLKIGLVFATKGTSSSKERSMKEASLLAIKDITGSKTTFRVIPFEADTESSPEKALSAVKKLYYENQVKFFVGLSNSEAVTLAQWAEANANDTLIITPHATATDLAKYSNIVQLSMTDQAFAYALHSQLIESKVTELIPIVRDDIYSLEIVDELRDIAGSVMNKLNVLTPIKYKAGSLEMKANEVLSQVKEVLKSHPNASIFLVGQNDARFILEKAYGDAILLSRMWYGSQDIALNYELLNSSKAVNTSRIVSLYSLAYGGDQFGRLKKRGHIFSRLSELLDEPPSLQAAMAYDAIQILYNTARATNTVNPEQIKRELKSKEDWGSGVSGQLLIDANGQRSSGDYLRVVVLPDIPDQNMVQVLMDGIWYIAGNIRVTKTDYTSKYGKRSAGSNVMSQIMSMSSSQSLGMSSGAIVNKSELLDLQGYLNSSCDNARIRVETIDPFSFRSMVKDYTKNTFPNMMVLPTVYGYQMRMSCQVPTGELIYEFACPPSESPQENKECVGLLTKPKSRRKLLLSSGTTGAIATCAGTTVGCAICGGVLGFFTLGISAAACIAPCSIAIGGSCTAATTLGIKEGAGTVICTELLQQGHLPLHLFLHDVTFGKRLGKENPHVFKGYHLLAKPIVWLMRRSEFVTNIVKTIALPWAEEMSYLEGDGASTSNGLGSLVMKVGIPLCTAIGCIVEACEAVVAHIPWAGISLLGSLALLGFPYYHFKMN